MCWKVSDSLVVLLRMLLYLRLWEGWGAAALQSRSQPSLPEPVQLFQGGSLLFLVSLTTSTLLTAGLKPHLAARVLPEMPHSNPNRGGD